MSEDRPSNPIADPLEDPWMGAVAPRRIPIIALAGMALLGTWVGLEAESFIPVVCLALIGLLLAALNRSATFLAFTFLFGVFWLNAWLDEHPVSPRELGKLIERERENINLIGVVQAEPEFREDVDGLATNLYLPIRVEARRVSSGWETVDGDVRVVIYDVPRRFGPEDLTYGDRVRVEGVIRVRDGPGARLGRTRYALTASRLARVDRDNGNAFLAGCYRVRQWASRQLARGIENDRDAVGVMRAMILGYRSEIPADLNRTFARTGTLHVFAISGLHVGIVTMFIIFVLRILGVSRLSYIFVLAPVLLGFVVCTGLKASAIRAGIMAILYWLGPSLRRRPDSRAAVALAVLGILWVAPSQLLTVGFLFSFLIVVGIIALYPVFFVPFQRLGLPDPWAVVEETPTTKRRQKIYGWFASLAAVSLAAWIVSTPLTAYFFNLFSPGGLLANIFVVPAATVIVIGGMISLLVGAVVPFLSFPINEVVRWVVRGLLWLTDGLHAIPFTWRFVVAPPLVGVLLYYAMVAAVARRSRLSCLWWGCLAGLVIGFIVSSLWQSRKATVEFYAFDRGQAQLLHTDAGAILIDTGPSFRSFQMQRYLRKAGINSLRAVVLTHSDSSHISGFEGIARGLPIDELWLADTHIETSSMADARRAWEALDIPVRRLKRGDHIEFSASESLEILHPDPTTAARATRGDDDSLVLRWNVGRRSLLFSGGASSRLEDQLMSEGVHAGADLVLLGHNLDWNVGASRWLKTVGAKDVIVPPRSFRQRGKWNYPLLDRIENAGAQIRRLDELGSIRVWVEDGKWEPMDEWRK